MRQILFFILIVTLASCSKFNSDDPFLPAQINSDLPIINITVDESEFDEMFEKTEEEIEIKGEFSLSRNQELLIEKEEVELELKGQYSVRFPLKTLGVKFEDKYDNRDRSLINPDKVLPHHNLDKIKAIRLRNSGNDFKKTMLKDLSMTQLAINAGLDIDLTYGEPAVVYVNGDFYGLMNLRTEANTNGISRLNDAKKDEVTLAKISKKELIKKDGDFERLDALLEGIEKKDIDFLKSEIDLPSFIDYMIFQSYVGNVDWPHNNVRFYAINDGKFRFILFDLDFASHLKMGHSPLTLIKDIWNPNMLSDLFMALYDDANDDSFQREFLERYEEILESGAISSDKFEAIVNENRSQIATEIEYQIEKYNVPRTSLEWEIELDKMMVLFREREEAVRAHLN